MVDTRLCLNKASCGLTKPWKDSFLCTLPIPMTCTFCEVKLFKLLMNSYPRVWVVLLRRT